MQRTAIAVLISLAAALPAAAHDFWIEPSTFHPKPGDTISLGLRVGQEFVGDPVPRSTALIERFVAESAAGETPVVGWEHQDPAGWLKVATSGPLLIAYRSKPVPLKLAADKFEEYLHLEGLDSVLAARAGKGDRSKPGNEIFSRCAKTLLDAGQGKGAALTQPVGMTLELVPSRNPYEGHASSLPFTLLYNGKPLPGALVVAIAQADGTTMSQRSDSGGSTTFRFPQGGVWLVKAVHMIPAGAPSGAEWESFWASVTFDLPQAEKSR